MFHVLVIGASSGSYPERGQLPEKDSIVKFQESQDVPVYYYFIDPLHAKSDLDDKVFVNYRNTIPDMYFTTICLPFNIDKFCTAYKIPSEEKAFFVDYSGTMSSEYVFQKHLGYNKNWTYYTPGCNGKKLHVYNDYKFAQTIPRYSLYGNEPVPKNVSSFYKHDILNDLNELIVYTRLLPEDVNDKKRPPEWMYVSYKLDNDINNMISLRNQSLDTLINFYKINTNDNLLKHNSNSWYPLFSKMLL